MAASREWDNTSADLLDTGEVTNYNKTSGDFTACAWLNVDTLTGTHAWMSNRGSASTGYQLRQTTSGVVGMTKFGTANLNSAHTIAAGTWSFVAEVVDMSSNVRHFVDADNDTDSNGNSCGSSGQTLEIGRLPTSSTSNEWDGKICQAHFWDGLLSIAEVQEARFKPGQVPAGMDYSYWPIWGDATEYDYGSWNNDCTVSGTTVSTDGPPEIHTPNFL